MTTISVALASHNGARHLPALLDSLKAQRRRPLEVVVSDDHSIDETSAIVEAAARESPFPVRFFAHRRPAGFGENFLHAASHCRGEWVAFCDQDDVWSADKLARVAQSANSADLVLHAGRVVDEAGRPTGERFPRVAARDARRTVRVNPLWTVPGFAVAVRRELLESAPYDRRPLSRLWENQMNHDEYAWFLAWSLGRIRLISDPLVDYRQHPANTVGVPVRKLSDTARESYRAGAGIYASTAALFAGYADWFSAELPDHPGSRRAEDRWRAIAARWRLRADLYEAAGMGARARCGVIAIGAGTYSSRRHGGFGAVSLVKDTMHVVGLIN